MKTNNNNNQIQLTLSELTFQNQNSFYTHFHVICNGKEGQAYFNNLNSEEPEFNYWTLKDTEKFTWEEGLSIFKKVNSELTNFLTQK